MLSDLRSTEEHAVRRLDLDECAGPGERTRAFRRFLVLETERLRMRHRRGLGGPEVARQRAHLVDRVVRRVVELAAREAGGESGLSAGRLAVLATGGYGRAELSPYSDVDLLFLHENGAERELSPLVESAVRQLWDSGLSVGHACRSVREGVDMVRDDLHSRNAIAEARIVAGNPELHERLEGILTRTLYSNRRSTARYLEAVRREWHERRARFGEVVCLLEPNVKESAGGLRDLHTLLWVGRALHGSAGLDGLHEAGHVSREERRALRRSFGFLSRVRNEAHFSAGRLRDRLDLELQQLVAPHLGYADHRGHLASERLMRDYYRQASRLAEIAGEVLERLWGRDDRPRLPLPPKRVGSRSGLVLRSGRLHPGQPAGEDGIPDASWITDVYETAQTTGAALSGELRRELRARVKGIGRRFRESPEAAAAFLRVLRRPGRVARTLRLMHETGFLGRYLPEIGRVTFLVQHDHYHCYTVDEHTLEALEALDRIHGGDGAGLSPFADAFAELSDPASLYLGLLLHDVGKGHGGGHVGKGVAIARRVCRRLGLEGRLAEDVELLVGRHLLMSRISQRRDLAEEQPVAELTRAVGDVDRLNRLLLLTYADINGVGPGIWNTWKATLLLDLYHKAHAKLAGLTGSQSQGAGTAVKRRALRELPPRFPRSVIERHYALLPDRYRRLIDFEALTRDLRLVAALESTPLVAEWRSSDQGRPDELTICTRDAPGRLAMLSGTLTAHGLDILGVDVYTREDDVVLDTFTVCRVGEFGPIETGRRRAVEDSLRDAVAGEADVEAAVARRRPGFSRRRSRLGGPSVRFDGEASPHSTVVEVRADDEPGLVYRIARVLADCGTAITYAKVATEKSHALDVFYVRNRRGERLSSEEMSRVEAALLEALGGSAR